MLPLKVLVADDHRLLRQGIVSLMKTRRDLVEVVGEASTGQEAVEMAAALQPDVILLDIKMPEGNGLQVAQFIRKMYPKIAVVILTASESDEDLYQAVQIGVAGYLLKSLDASELFDLLNSVANGEAALTRAMAARLFRSISHHATDKTVHDSLTEREMDVLKLVANGASNPQIAEQLCITVNTVKVHLHNILEKLQVQNRAEAAVYAVSNGLVNSKNSPIG